MVERFVVGIFGRETHKHYNKVRQRKQGVTQQYPLGVRNLAFTHDDRGNYADKHYRGKTYHKPEVRVRFALKDCADKHHKPQRADYTDTVTDDNADFQFARLGNFFFAAFAYHDVVHYKRGGKYNRNIQRKLCQHVVQRLDDVGRFRRGFSATDKYFPKFAHNDFSFCFGVYICTEKRR